MEDFPVSTLMYVGDVSDFSFVKFKKSHTDVVEKIKFRPQDFFFRFSTQNAGGHRNLKVSFFTGKGKKLKCLVERKVDL